MSAVYMHIFPNYYKLYLHCVFDIHVYLYSILTTLISVPISTTLDNCNTVICLLKGGHVVFITKKMKIVFCVKHTVPHHVKFKNPFKNETKLSFLAYFTVGC